MVLSSNSPIPLIAKLIILMLFLAALYIALWFKDWRLLLASLLGFTLIIILGIYEGSTMLLFGFTFADLIGRAKKKWHIAIGMIAIAFMFFIVIWFESGASFKLQSQAIIPIMIIQLLFPMLIYYVEKSKKLQSELTVVNTQLVQQEERQRIARDLHDTLGHTLTMIKIKSELTSKLVDKDTTRVKDELNDILATTRTALKQVRELVSDMNFISLESELIHCKQHLQTADISIKIRNNCPKLLLASVEETMLSLCLREATTNIIKHSQAKKCQIDINYINGVLRINVADDGVGLHNQGHGNGLSSMKERMKALQGNASIDNLPNGGTIVTLTMPIQHYKKESTT
ncbi:sensor histidine kinase [Lysinibacillus sp. JNUCC 51]|uniref:sensor histidine kinase n=1 Tax=Lysinibacillus sp. JNUCC-51 TaxID=2792479 RepID=UPI0019361483|nr:sensor histidine kinase [Lysinibacillus sp. JNUCC-51]